MQYRVDIKTGNKISALGFGCMRFPWGASGVDFERSEKLVLAAVESGVNYFDTAYLYPGNEKILGRIVEKNNLRKQIFIATKLPFAKCKCYEDFDYYLDIQLERLKTTYIDYYFIHAICEASQWVALCDIGVERWIEAKKLQGKIRQVGFSFHGNIADFEKIIEAYQWDFCMIQYNYINTTYQAGLKGLNKAFSMGVTTFIMEPLLGGKLAKGLPAKAVELFKTVAPSYSPAEWSLRWLWNQPQVTMVLSGMNQLEHIAENARIAEQAVVGNISQEQDKAIKQVVEIFNSSYKLPCTGCNYCLPCPVGINIPDCFSAYNSSYSIGRFTGVQQYITSTGGINSKARTANICIKCGKCEAACPQHIKIPTELVAVDKRLAPPLVKFVIALRSTFAKLLQKR